MRVLTTSDPYVMGNDLETGAEVWKVEAMMGEVGPSVAFADGVVFAVNEYARLIAVEPKAGASFIWENDEFLSRNAPVPSPTTVSFTWPPPAGLCLLRCQDRGQGLGEGSSAGLLFLAHDCRREGLCHGHGRG
ncbi:MAG: hypothetical protein R2751_15275 [Bacteroidales bacterium]